KARVSMYRATRCGAGYGKLSRPFPQQVDQHGLSCSRVGSVAGDVVGKRRRRYQWCPRGVTKLGSNRSDGTPLVIGIFRIPGGDHRIGARGVEQQKNEGGGAYPQVM